MSSYQLSYFQRNPPTALGNNLQKMVSTLFQPFSLFLSLSFLTNHHVLCCWLPCESPCAPSCRFHAPPWPNDPPASPPPVPDNTPTYRGPGPSRVPSSGPGSQRHNPSPESGRRQEIPRGYSLPSDEFCPIPPRADPPTCRCTVRIGVGNRSPSGINIEVYDNVVAGGCRRVSLNTGNRAGGANRGLIANNLADCDDLLIGVDNVAGSGDNDVRIYDNDFRGGFRSVHVGVGNRAGGSNRIVVAGSPSPPRQPGQYAYTQPGPDGYGGVDDGGGAAGN